MTGYVYALFSTLIWGLVYSVDQGLLARYHPASLMFLSSCTTLTLGFIAYKRDDMSKLLLDFKSVLMVIVIAILSWCATRLTLSSIQTIGAARASIVEATYPLWACFFCWILYQQTLDLNFLIGALLVIVGVSIIVSH